MNTWWLLKYYFLNLVNCKIRSKRVSENIHLYSEKWFQIKDRITNSEEVLVVGNGPSLHVDDLVRLNHIPSIASNKIFLLFENTEWRPTLYTICDPLLAYKLREYEFNEFDYVLCSAHIYHLLKKCKIKIPWKNIWFNEAENEFKANGTYNPDPLNGIFEAFSIVNQGIQLAIWLGAKTVYITGCDHYYQEEKSEKAGKKTIHKFQNHFHPDYRKKGEIVNNAPVDKMNKAFELVNLMSKSLGVNVINVSRKSALEAFPKMSIEEIL